MCRFIQCNCFDKKCTCKTAKVTVLMSSALVELIKVTVLTKSTSAELTKVTVLTQSTHVELTKTTVLMDSTSGIEKQKMNFPFNKSGFWSKLEIY